jgi:hypothetical protein
LKKVVDGRRNGAKMIKVERCKSNNERAERQAKKAVDSDKKSATVGEGEQRKLFDTKRKKQLTSDKKLIDC